MNLRLALFVLLLFIPGILIGQPGDPGGDPDVPITGIEILLALGGMLGIKRLMGFNSKSKKS